MDAKKLIALVAIVFLGFWMFTDPSGLRSAYTWSHSMRSSSWTTIAARSF